MPFYHEINFTGTVKGNPTIKPNKFDPTKNDVSFRILLDPQTLPLGDTVLSDEKEFDQIWINTDTDEKTVPDHIKEGSRLLVKARLTGSAKGDDLPTNYYVKASEILPIKGNANINSFIGRAKIHKVVSGTEIANTTKFLLKEPKRAFGGKKPDYKTNAGYHFYIALLNSNSASVFKEGEYILIQGRLVRGIFDLTGLDKDAMAKKNQPLILIDKVAKEIPKQ